VGQVLEALADHDVLTEPPVRIVDHEGAHLAGLLHDTPYPPTP
jgi:hypothetical protein